MYEATGTIKLINDTQTFPSGFSKREFVITTAHDKYPQDLKFEVVKDRCAMLDDLQVGEQVQDLIPGLDIDAAGRLIEEQQDRVADLLRRMRLEVPGYRPAVIDEELYRLLDDFRGFRHAFRNCYSFELDWERERLVASRFRPAAALLHAQVNAFLAKLDGLNP